MLLWLSQFLQTWFHSFQVFQYLSLRTILAVLTAFFLSIIFGPKLIRFLKNYKLNQFVRDDGPQSHLSKSGTPTMGGVLIVFSITLTVLLWNDLTNLYVLLVLFSLLSFSAVGFFDDIRKFKFSNSKGITAKRKIALQSLFALMISFIIYFKIPGDHTQIVIPFFKNLNVHLGWSFILLSYLVIVGSSNAVNLTDGLDGLAIMPVVMICGALGVFAYVSGNFHHANYLLIPYIPGAGELAVFSGAVFGAGLGFLWFNTYPAQIFMGDTGSLGLGAMLGTIAVIVRQELLLFIMGGGR